MCAGRLGSASGNNFPVTVDCGDWGTSGLSLTLNLLDGSQLLVLNTPGGPLVWIPDTPSETVDSGSDSTLPNWLTGTWAPQVNTSYETFVISSSGSIS
jgi:hypothetical protein